MEQANKDPVGLAVEVFLGIFPEKREQDYDTQLNNMKCACDIVKFAQGAFGSANGSTDDGATDKQKIAMKNMKIEFKEDISKADAKKLISEKIATFN